MNPPKCRILCVDDNEDTRFMLSTLLQREGYEVSTADSLVEAKRAVSSGQFDMTILDNRFTGGSGVDPCRWLRGKAPQTPVIFYSGAAFDEDKEQGLRAGAAAYVIKPDIDGLLASVSELLRKKVCAASSAS